MEYSSKVHPRTSHEGLKVGGGQMCYSTLPSTSALDGGGVNAKSQRLYPSGKTRYPLYRRLGGPQGRSGRVQKIWPPHRVSIPGPSSPQRVAIQST